MYESQVPIISLIPQSQAFTSLHSRSSFNLDSDARLQTANNVRAKINQLMATCHSFDPRVKTETIALVRRLIATKQLFSQTEHDSVCTPPSFALHAQVKNLVVGSDGVAFFLRNISPNMAEDFKLVEKIQEIVNESVPGRHARTDPQDSMVAKIDPQRPPSTWPRDAMLFVLRLGIWDGINLSGANLRDLDLQDVKWPGVDLSEAQLQRSDLSNSSLTNGNLSRCNLTGSNLQYTHLAGANLDGAIADHANLRHANLTRVHAKDAFFLKADFEYATLCDTDLERAHMEYAKWIPYEEGVSFIDARLHLASVVWKRPSIKPSGLNETFWVRQLQTLSTIHPRHDDIHNEIVRRLIDGSGADEGRLSDLTALTHLLLRQQRCWPDQQLRNFIDRKILPPLLMRWNSDNVRTIDPSLKEVMTYLCETRPALDWPKYCSAVALLQLDAVRSNEYGRRNVLGSLLKAHPAIASIAAEMAKKGLKKFEEYCVFIAPGLDKAILYPNEKLQQMADGSGSPYNGYYWAGDKQGRFSSDILRNLDAIEACQVPLGRYNVEPPPLAAIRLFNHIFDGCDFKDRFIDALTCKTVAPQTESAGLIAQSPTVEMGSMNHLKKFFGLSRKTHINLLQCRIFWEKFSGVDMPLENSEANIARMFLCLGTLVVRYSSSALFGTQTDSLNNLRIFAWACIHSAYMLDPKLMGDPKTVRAIGRTLKDAQSQLQSIDTLTEDLLALINQKMPTDPALAICFKALYPQAGR